MANWIDWCLLVVSLLATMGLSQAWVLAHIIYNGDKALIANVVNVDRSLTIATLFLSICLGLANYGSGTGFLLLGVVLLLYSIFVLDAAA